MVIKMPKMNKTEKKAYEWLKKTGHKHIIFRGKTPDFQTDKGFYEIKRGYVMSTQSIKILFSYNQRELIQKNNAITLVFLDDKPDPIAQIKPQDIFKERINNIILYDIEKNMRIINVRIEPEDLEKIREFVRERKYESVNNFIRMAIIEKIKRESEPMRVF